MEIREPSKGEMEEYYSLRWRILREPWRQPRGSEKDALEDRGFHAAAFENNKIIGVGRLDLSENKEAQIRYMAVEEKGKGAGTAIIQFLENKAKREGAERITLNARENAVHFYEKNGYKNIGKSHVLFGEIQHFKMEKVFSTVRFTHKKNTS